MTEPTAHGGWDNRPTFDFEIHAPNVLPIYEALSLFAGVCLRRVPGMTDETLGRNIKDNARIVVEQARSHERLRFLGWGDCIEIAQSSARDWVELGDAVGLDQWDQISETYIGAAWREIGTLFSQVKRECLKRRGDDLHDWSGEHRTTPRTAASRSLELHQSALRSHLNEIGD